MSKYYKAENVQITNTEIPEKTTLYNAVRIFNSKLEDDCQIGDFTTMREAKLENNVIINRHNEVMNTEIGKYTCTGRFTSLHDCKIGRFCSISWLNTIGGDDHDYKLISTHPFYYNPHFGFTDDWEYKNKKDEEDIKNSPCVVGNDVWIAANCNINRNVHVGNGAIIAAGAVVTKDVEPYTIVAGVPAKPIGKRFDEETIKRLEEIKWWDFPEEYLKKNIELFKKHINNSVLDKLEEIKKEIDENGK